MSSGGSEHSRSKLGVGLEAPRSSKQETGYCIEFEGSLRTQCLKTHKFAGKWIPSRHLKSNVYICVALPGAKGTCKLQTCLEADSTGFGNVWPDPVVLVWHASLFR